MVALADVEMGAEADIEDVLAVGDPGVTMLLIRHRH